jgi:tetratricopeptide (TPR) repeat protein
VPATPLADRAGRTGQPGRTDQADRATRLHAAALAASDDGRPATAVRQLRAGLRLIGPGADGGDPASVEIRGRLLISLAWAESERGRVAAGFRLLDEAERHIPPEQRPVLLAQRGLLLKRSGRNEDALRQYDEAEALLTERSSPLDLVKMLNNRSLVHLEAGHVRLARADLRRCGQVAARHGLALHVALSRVNLGCMDVVAGDLPAALGAFAAAQADFERLAPGRLASVAVERARALVAAGLFTEADRELAYAAEQAGNQRLSYIYADAVQVRAEAALLAGRAQDAAQWARDARARFLGRDNARRAALASLLELRAGLASAGGPTEAGGPATAGEPTTTGGHPAAIAVRAQSLARQLSRLGLPEDARVAGLVAARALISAGQPARAARAAARHGPPGRVDRLDTRPPRPPGTCWPGWPRCTGTAPSSAASTCRPAPRCTGRISPARGSPPRSPAGHRTPCTGGRNAPGPRRCCCPRCGRRTTRPPRRRWRSCGRPGTRCVRGSWPGGRPAACAPASRRCSAASASSRGPHRGGVMPWCPRPPRSARSGKAWRARHL